MIHEKEGQHGAPPPPSSSVTPTSVTESCPAPFNLSTGQTTAVRMNLSCFSSSDPAAVNATLLYDEDTDHGDLWSRSIQDGPLRHCPSSGPPPDRRCLVCLLGHIVFAVCRNLADGVKIIMEAVGQHVKISKSGCPKPPSHEAPTEQLHGNLVFIFLLLLLAAAGIIMAVCAYRRRTRTKTESEPRGFLNGSPASSGPTCRAETLAQVFMPDGGDDVTKADK